TADERHRRVREDEMTTDDLTTAQTAAGTSRPVAPRIAVRLFAGAAAVFGADATTVHAATLEEVIAVLRRDGSAEAGRVIDRSASWSTPWPAPIVHGCWPTGTAWTCCRPSRAAERPAEPAPAQRGASVAGPVREDPGRGSPSKPPRSEDTRIPSSSSCRCALAERVPAAQYSTAPSRSPSSAAACSAPGRAVPACAS